MAASRRLTRSSWPASGRTRVQSRRSDGMRSPASAIDWELRKRYLPTLIAIVCYLLILDAVKALIGSMIQPVRLEHDGRLGVAIAPLSVAFLYFLAVFSFGLQGDLGGRASLYPARLFT